MNKLLKRTGLMTLIAAGLAIATPAMAATPTSVNVSSVTNAFSEHNLFEDHLAKARQEILVGRYDTATMHTNEARRWFLAFADSVALEKPTYSWDNVRSMESNLLSTYADLGRLYHIAGKYQNSVNVLAASLSVNPYQPEARYQQMLAYVALQDANDTDIDANDVERIESDLNRINRMDDIDNNGIIDAWEDLDQDGIKDNVDPMIDTDRDGISDLDDEDINLDLDLDGDQDVIIDVE